MQPVVVPEGVVADLGTALQMFSRRLVVIFTDLKADKQFMLYVYKACVNTNCIPETPKTLNIYV